MFDTPTVSKLTKLSRGLDGYDRLVRKQVYGNLFLATEALWKGSNYQ